MIIATHFFPIINMVINMNQNVFFFLKNKSEVDFLYGSMTIQQGLEEMKRNAFTSTPVIDENGRYLGSISQGDFLWYLYNTNNKENIQSDKVKAIIRKDYIKACNINTSLPELLQQSLNQNYIPIVDDRDVFIGIVTRKSILEYFLNQ